MKIKLWRHDNPVGDWLTVEDMIGDLQRGKIKLQPGDKLFVQDTPPVLRVVT